MAHEGDKAIIEHYCSKLGVTLAQFADQCHIEAYCSGEKFSAPETQRLVEVVREQREAEDRDVADAKWYRRPAPKTVWDSLGDMVGLKQVNG